MAADAPGGEPPGEEVLGPLLSADQLKTAVKEILTADASLARAQRQSPGRSSQPGMITATQQHFTAAAASTEACKVNENPQLRGGRLCEPFSKGWPLAVDWRVALWSATGQPTASAERQVMVYATGSPSGPSRVNHHLPFCVGIPQSQISYKSVANQSQIQSQIHFPWFLVYFAHLGTQRKKTEG